MDRLNK
jgi:hypothetical protein